MCSDGANASNGQRPSRLVRVSVGQSVSLIAACSNTQTDMNAFVAVDSTANECTGYVVDYRL